MRRSTLVSLVTVAVLLSACNTPDPISASAALPPAEATPVQSDTFETQVAAYLQAFPYQITYDYTLRFTGGDPTKLNVWAVGNEPALVRAGQDRLPRTSNDTFIKAAALLLEDGPVVLESKAPAADRFNSLQLIDERNVNYRNVIYPKGKYTLYFGAKPGAIEGEAIEVPSKSSFVLVRVEVRNKADAGDVAAAEALFNGIEIHGPRAAAFPKVDLLGGYPPEVAAEAQRRMDQIFASVPFTKTVVGPGQEPGADVPYLYHAAGSKNGWGGPDPAHSAYEALLFDERGREMRGANGVYVVTTEEPPVDAFWSVTVYDTERGGFLHPNQNDRYHINNTLAKRNPDGTVTFTFKQACEAADLNCIEVPAGRFELVTRYYLPHDEVISGAWSFPRPALARD